MYSNRNHHLTIIAAIALLAFPETRLCAVDLESFEFDESLGAILSQTANAANPGNNWVESNLLTDSETDGAGNFRITKFNDGFADNFLQIDNFNSGSRYIVAEMSGWAFRDNVPNDGEEIRFAFLNDDAGDSGATVTAEVRIDRNTDDESIELRGLAVGGGSSNIANRATLNTDQSADFTMVLELNKTSNTYEIFYKDGAGPSQALGIGSVSPGRDGNSVRFVVNNNFGSDVSEFFSIDRVALTDTNPLTDLLTLEVDRDLGQLKLINTSGATVSGVQSVTFSSDIGALDVDQLMQFAGDLNAGQEVVLSDAGGAWIQNPTEDVRVELNLTGGGTRAANVNFVGNGGERFEFGDLNFDGSLTVDDWIDFIAGAETDLSGLTVAEAYQRGDLDADGVNSILDFGIFKAAFDAANGAGAFQAMLASVPEPATASLVSVMTIAVVLRRRRRRHGTR